MNYYGIPHVIGDRLAIIGGCLSATEKVTNRVSTFDEDSQTWRSYYPDLLSIRGIPGVVSHLEHVIVAGGKCIDERTIQDDIAILTGWKIPTGEELLLNFLYQCITLPLLSLTITYL